MAHVHIKKLPQLDPRNPSWVFKQAPGGKLFTAETPQEMHRRLVWGDSVCSLCAGRPVVIAARIFYPSDELAKSDPLGLARGEYPLAQHIDKRKAGCPYHTMPALFSCTSCQKALEQGVARQVPSWAIVHWDRGVSPDAMKPIVQGADVER